ncbi:hypothetical protein V7S43_004536 [Phytophthora oleae]|uniref:AB hydrolase-1 domain-containing protein n=1 Tax=Phytophthora oleae TaxID=2107226 RepID=A0ABD3FTY9_9STRA
MSFATHHKAWTPIIDMLLDKWDAVKHKRNVKLVSFDNRGIGGSDAPWWRYTTSRMVLDALALMDYLGWESAHVVGLSMGGMISLELATTTPKRVQSLTLMVTTRGKYVENPRANGLIKQSLDAKLPEDVAKAQMQMLFSDISLDQPMDFGSKTRRNIIYEHAVLLHAKQRVKPRFVGVMNQVMALRTHWVSDERLAAINDAGFPVLLVGGAMNILIPPREM